MLNVERGFGVPTGCRKERPASAAHLFYAINGYRCRLIAQEAGPGTDSDKKIGYEGLFISFFSYLYPIDNNYKTTR